MHTRICSIVSNEAFSADPHAYIGRASSMVGSFAWDGYAHAPEPRIVPCDQCKGCGSRMREYDRKSGRERCQYCASSWPYELRAA